jgi:ribosome recycling factor
VSNGEIDIQELTDSFISKIDEILANKESEVIAI